MKEGTTRERILDAAEAIMLQESFHSVGLNRILAAVKVPKGSFYHYFESKEQFGVEMLKHYVANATAYKTRILLSTSPEEDPLQRLLTFFETGVAKCQELQGRCPCLLVKLTSEVADFSEPMRKVLADANRNVIGIFERLLREGIAKKGISDRVDPAIMAAVIQDLWSGALQRAATQRDTTPLRQAINFLRVELAPA
ncbi:MAG: TetR/AcrR family transcriptional regulator [Terrimicrobiaceae bacterium]|nr:TetR/AcrR family transcriptional regulator [Terrimicrobiaceae bacterium]